MEITVEFESGGLYSLYGIGLSFGLTSDLDYEHLMCNYDLQKKLLETSKKLASKNGGHNKFLESIDIYVTINAPRYFWQQFDTYRLLTKQSESTMHTLLKKPISQDMFKGLNEDDEIYEPIIQRLEELRKEKDIRQLKRELPESFLQRRSVKLSYMNLRNMIQQRKKHKLEEWNYFCEQMIKQIKHPYYIEDLLEVK